jgi:hypothetical protein
MQYRDGTIEFVAPVALAVMIDEYAIFGPQFGNRLSSFLGVSLSEHLMEIAFGSVSIASGMALSHTFAERLPFNPAPTRCRCGARIRPKSRDDADDHPLRDLNALRISPANNFGCSKAAKCPPLSSSFQ